MKNTGIVRKLDELGRITLPKELRRTLGIEDRDPLEIYTEDDTIVLKKYSGIDKCKHCGSTEDVVKSEDIVICKKCASKVLSIFR
jgi:AbrB family transcriptional regulator, transcriptional pleiotropic regulator of transition state genes